MVSSDVVIMTREELERERSAAYRQGVERGKFEARYGEFKPTHRHYKGGVYQVVAHGRVSDPIYLAKTEVTIYRNEAGDIWVRPRQMFEGEVDGKPRFAPIGGSPCKACLGSGVMTLLYFKGPVSERSGRFSHAEQVKCDACGGAGARA
jgi:hypothetical protein